MRVCFENARKALGDQKDYKKIKYYLKIAKSVAEQQNKMGDFNHTLNNLK